MENQLKQKRLTLKQLKSEITKLESKIDEIKTKKQKPPVRYTLYFALTLIATGVIAWSTYNNWHTTEKMLNQMKLQTSQTDTTITIQSDYYQKTTRPFLYMSDFDLEPKDSKFDTVNIHYKLKNAGTLPAKNVSAAMVTLSSELPDTVFERIFWPPKLRGAIFPNQEVEFTANVSPVHIDFLKKENYLHLIVKYFDVGDNSYYFRQIALLRITDLETKQISWELKPLRVFFN